MTALLPCSGLYQIDFFYRSALFELLPFPSFLPFSHFLFQVTLLISSLIHPMDICIKGCNLNNEKEPAIGDLTQVFRIKRPRGRENLAYSRNGIKNSEARI